jgi:hypothetical protein
MQIYSIIEKYSKKCRKLLGELYSQNVGYEIRRTELNNLMIIFKLKFFDMSNNKKIYTFNSFNQLKNFYNKLIEKKEKRKKENAEFKYKKKR